MLTVTPSSFFVLRIAHARKGIENSAEGGPKRLQKIVEKLAGLVASGTPEDQPDRGSLLTHPFKKNAAVVKETLGTLTPYT